MSPLVLAVESSCDETAVAIVRGTDVIASLVATQEDHSLWGGVVPELASRLHQRTLTSLADEAVKRAGIEWDQLDAVAATVGPGLIGALLVGSSYAKGLATGLNIPFIGVNHLEGHLWSSAAAGQDMPLPALCMLVSGGHTELIRIDGFDDYTLLGATLDDAAGEAFDKVGGLLGIQYPAGAELSKLAEHGNDRAIDFKVARTQYPLDFSFSGLKSAALREVERLQSSDLDARASSAGADNDREGFDSRPSWHTDLAASFQRSVIRQLTDRLAVALESNGFHSVTIGGGVAANKKLREEAETVVSKHGIPLLVPPLSYCTDNAAMIAWVAARAYEHGRLDPLTVSADPNMTIE